jgi:transmembrane 9 superfamily protein 2/4
VAASGSLLLSIHLFAVRLISPSTHCTTYSLQLYFVFGFLFIVLIILVATCAEITIVMCYFQLCNEDYRWWWRSYLSAGSSGGYLFLYSMWYFFSKLSIEGLVPSVLYFSYMGMISITFFILTGSIGFFACLWFVRRIYGAIKVD